MIRRAALTSFQQEDKPQHPSGYQTKNQEGQQDQTAAGWLRRHMEEHRGNHDSFTPCGAKGSKRAPNLRVGFQRILAGSRIAIPGGTVRIARASTSYREWRRSARGIG